MGVHDKHDKKSHARITYMPLKEPNPTPDTEMDRDAWIEEVFAGFVSPSKKNREYYKVILETLWPKGHGIPGPLIEEGQIRDAINSHRGAPYIDTFRRVRELQGEEGLFGIVKGGNKYQLVDLTISKKRAPRIHLNDSDWKAVLDKYSHSCAACGRTQAEKGFQQDHKVPRLRGGGDNLENWQPLCDECNNFKSTACRDCRLDCAACCWAYPEKYKPLKLPGELISRLRKYAERTGKSPDQIAADLIREKLDLEEKC